MPNRRKIRKAKQDARTDFRKHAITSETHSKGTIQITCRCGSVGEKHDSDRDGHEAFSAHKTSS